MRFSKRLDRLERGKPTRILVLRNDRDGTPELVGVVGGGIYERDNFHNDEVFWAAIHADEERA